MNLYFLVEGEKTEKRVYRAWIAHIFPALLEVDRIEDIHDNHFLLISGYGYPSYVNRIAAALTDIARHGSIDHFFICIDAEAETPERKREETQKLLIGISGSIRHSVIVHNCCIETWFLGNDRFMRRNPEGEILRKWKDFYDVRRKDPEEMGCPPEYRVRAQFHFDYLREMFRERGVTYSKSRPGSVVEKSYLAALVRRQQKTGHLKSFAYLIEVWLSLGGTMS